MKETPCVLIIEENDSLRETLKSTLSRSRYRVVEACDIASAHRFLKKRFFDLILLGVHLPDGSGMDVLRKISVHHRKRAIFITGHGTLDQAVDAMRRGAFGFLEKPLDIDALLATIKNAVDINRDLDHFRHIKEEIGEGPSFINIISKSRAMNDVIEKAKESSRTNKPILVTGEPGTGKKLLAHAIHRASDRKNKRFITVDCSAVPVHLADAELFGLENGVFSADGTTYPGKLMLTEGGTLYLDKIDELHPEIQTKLLHVLESGEIGSSPGMEARKPGIRVIAATDKILAGHGKNADFRHDLYHRIAGIKIHIPPLRERTPSILPLTQHFISTGNVVYSKNVKEIHPDVQKCLSGYPWPGNVGELKKIIDEIMAYIDGEEIKIRHLPPRFREKKIIKTSPNSFGSLEEAEKNHIRKILHFTGHNIQESAKILGLGRPALYRKIEKYKLDMKGKTD